MSMPRVVGTTITTVPGTFSSSDTEAADETMVKKVPGTFSYLLPDVAKAAFWADRLKPIMTRKIGLAWAGRPEHPNDRRRSIPPDVLRALANVPNATFILVQPRSANVAMPGGLPLLDLGSQLMDFADTAALLSQLDLLISVDTSVAHLAGALGKPTWLLLPFSPDWRWLMQRSDTPWYPSMTLFRQKKLGDWPEVIGRVSKVLSEGAAAVEGSC